MKEKRGLLIKMSTDKPKRPVFNPIDREYDDSDVVSRSETHDEVEIKSGKRRVFGSAIPRNVEVNDKLQPIDPYKYNSEGPSFSFKNLPQNVSIPKDSEIEAIIWSKNSDWRIKANFEGKSTVSEAQIEKDENGSLVKYHRDGESGLEVHISNYEIDFSYYAVNPEDISEKAKFHIETNLTIEESDAKLQSELTDVDVDIKPENEYDEVKEDDIRIERESKEDLIQRKTSSKKNNYVKSPLFYNLINDGNIIRKIKTPILITSSGREIKIPMTHQDGEFTLHLDVIELSESEFPILIDPTYSSGSDYINDGDSISHTTESGIDITSAQVRWKGDSDTSSTTEDTYSYKNYYGPGSYLYSTGSDSESGTIPYPDKGTTQYTRAYNGQNRDDGGYGGQDWGSITSTFTLSGGISGSNTKTWDSGSSSGGLIETGPSSATGDSVTFGYSIDSYDVDSDKSGEIGARIADGKLSGDTSYPIFTQTVSETTNTTETKTQDPSVNISETGDSVNGPSSVDDGSFTSWYSISMQSGKNTFNHSINGSNNAYFEFEYDYQFSTPTVVKRKRITHGGQNHDLPLVDPNDNALEYDNLLYYVDGQVLAADLVQPDDPDASNLRVKIPSYGILAWRQDLS